MSEPIPSTIIPGMYYFPERVKGPDPWSYAKLIAITVAME